MTQEADRKFNLKSEKTSTSYRFFATSTVMFYLISNFNKRILNKWIRRTIVLVLAVVRGSVTNIFYLQEGQVIYGQTALEVVTLILHNLH